MSDAASAFDTNLPVRLYLKDHRASCPVVFFEQSVEDGVSGPNHRLSAVGAGPVFRSIQHKGNYRYSDNGQIKSLSGYKTHHITDRTIDFISHQSKAQPASPGAC